MSEPLWFGKAETYRHIDHLGSYPTQVFYKERDFKKFRSFTMKSPFESSEKCISPLR